MTLAFALAAALLFGTGAYLLLKADLVRFVLGIVLISQSAVLTIIAAGVVAGRAPIHPLPDGPVSDPLTQAMALTAIVISLAVTALLLVLVARVSEVHRTIERDEVAGAAHQDAAGGAHQDAAGDGEPGAAGGAAVGR